MTRSIVISVRDRRSDRVRRFAFEKDCTIGRATTCDLVLAHTEVQPFQFRIAVGDDTAVLGDRVLRAGDELAVADYTVRVELVGGTPDAIGYALNGDRPYTHDPDETPFLDALRANPADHQTRQVYADWLDERGYHHRAEYLRVQTAIADDRADARRDRKLHDLSPSSDPAWRTLASRPPIRGCEPSWTFKCPKRWDALAPTDDPNVRHCGTCAREVTFCVTIDQVRDRAREKACVAFDPAMLRHEAEQAYAEPDPMVMEMGEVAMD